MRKDGEQVLLLGPRRPEDFSVTEVQAYRNSGVANGYHKSPRITDTEVRRDMANAEALANDLELQALTSFALLNNLS